MRVILEGFKRLLPHLPPLAGGDGKGKPLLTPREVVFNGQALEGDYETFAFPGHFGEIFCKTGPNWERKRPYDLAVRAFLLLARFHLGEAMTLSGDAPLADWAEAASLIEAHVHLPVDVYWALGYGLLRVEDSKGRSFLVEGKRPWEELQGLLPRLEALHRERLLFWPFQGPYRLLGEARLPQEDLPRLYTGSFYRAQEG